MILLLLSSCATGAAEAPRYAQIPLKTISAADQKAMADRIVAACGSPVPRCAPGSAEQHELDYVELRAAVKAAHP